jgi:hypothetical protein
MGIDIRQEHALRPTGNVLRDKFAHIQHIMMLPLLFQLVALCHGGRKATAP